MRSRSIIHVCAFILTLLPAAAPAVTAPESFAPLVKAHKASVVNISTRQVIKVKQPSPFGDPQMDQFFYRFFGGQQPPREQVRQSLGSGFVISADGYILTNNHVVDQATDIRVSFDDGRILEAKLIGRSPEIDIALIKVEATGLQAVTKGIVSAKGRVIGAGPYDDLIQTDAAINPGNSGGPLFNTSGQVVGINTMILAKGQNLGFAVPMNMVKDVLPSLREKGRPDLGWLGVDAQAVTPEIAEALGMPDPIGAIVRSVTKGGPADKAGLLRGDVIIELDGKKILSPAELPRMIAFGHIGKTVTFKVGRQGKTIEVKVVVEKRPEKS